MLSRYRDPIYQQSRGWPVTALEQAENENDADAQLYLAFRSYNVGDVQQTLLWYERAASQGSQEAMLNLLKLYEFGDGIPPNIIEACRWMKVVLETTEFNYEKGTEVKRDLMYSYGWYLLGEKTPVGQQLPLSKQDAKQGLHYLDQAAELGHVEAASHLGNLYVTNQHPNIPLDVAMGKRYFQKAAEMGKGQCAFQLAMIYRAGIVPINPNLEQKWLEVAAELGNEEAKMQLANGKNSYLKAGKAKKRLKELDQQDKDEVSQYLPIRETLKCSNPPCSAQDTPEGKFQVCGRCRSVKYCSRDCQVTHYRTEHKKDCKRLEAAKDDIIEKNRNLAAPLVECFAPACHVKQSKEDRQFILCFHCMHARYCSKKCQSKHWRAGHKEECSLIVQEEKDADALLAKLKARNNYTSS